MTNGRGHSLMAFAAALAVVLLVVGATLAFHAGSPKPSSTPAPSLIAAVPSATSDATAGPTPSPATTAPPSPRLPSADSYPLVDSCLPSSVGWAAPVTSPDVARAGSFELQVPILMYHRIVPLAQAGDSIPGLVVPPDVFSAQLDALRGAGWHTITMAQLASDLQAHVKPSPRTFVITIDDGWDDGYTYAFPILARHGFVATYFVIAGRIDMSGFLSSAHLKALTAAGDEIGDHTMDHVDLARQTAGKLKYEVDAAAARIAQVTGHWPESLAYPSGAVDTVAAAAVAACGELRTAVIEGPPRATGSAAPNASPTPATMPPVYETWANRWTIPRLRVSPGTMPAYLLAELNHYS